MHADHVTGTGLLKKLLPGSKSLISKSSGAQADVYVQEGFDIQFGRHRLTVRSTPGHTNGMQAVLLNIYLNKNSFCHVYFVCHYYFCTKLCEALKRVKQTPIKQLTFN
jgi:hypothetical protein